MGVNFGYIEPFSAQAILWGTYNYIDAIGIFSDYIISNAVGRCQYPIVSNDTSTAELGTLRFWNITSNHSYLPWLILK